MDKCVKSFYLYTIGLLIKCESFEAVKKIVKNILTIANNQLEGELPDVGRLPAEESRRELLKLIRSHDMNFIDNEDHNEHKPEEVM